MDAKEIADVIEGCIIPGGTDIHRLDGPYIFNGILEDKTIERLEVGRVVGGVVCKEYKSLVQIKLYPSPKTPEFEKRKNSCLYDEWASGTVYEITKEQYESIETQLKKCRGYSNL